MEPCDPHRVIYQWAGVQYSRADLEHKLLGKRGLNVDAQRWLLNDELILALARAIEAETPSETTGVLAPFMLSAMFGLAATPPRHQTVHERHFAKKSRQAGVVFLPPCHWIFVLIEVRDDYLGVHFVDSLNIITGSELMKAKTREFARRYFPVHLERGLLDFTYRQAARQVNPFDCGILALDALSRVLSNLELPSEEYGNIENTALLRVHMCRLLEKHGKVIRVLDIDDPPPSRSTLPQHQLDHGAPEDDSSDLIIIRTEEPRQLERRSTPSPPRQALSPQEEAELLSEHIPSAYALQ